MTEYPQITDLIYRAFTANRSLSEELSHPLWSRLYVRAGRGYLLGQPVPCIIKFANIEAKHPGQGSLSGLLAWLEETHTDYPVLFECVLSSKLMKGLQRRDFKLVPDTYPGDLWKRWHQ